MDTSTSTEESTRTVQRPSAPDRGQSRESRPLEVNAIRHGSVIADSDRSGSSVESVRTTGDSPRSFTDHQKQMLANLDATGDVNSSTGTTLRTVESGSTPAAPVVAPTPAAVPAAAPAVPVETKPETPAADHPDAKQLADVTARAERLAEHNRRLVGELERAKTRQAPVLDKRMAALDEIEKSWTTDPYTALRRLTALNAGIEDANAPEVDEMLQDVYAEWTGKELKMPMDPGRRALIESKRNRILMTRDKRDQEAVIRAQEEAKSASAEQAKHAEVGQGINARLEKENHAEKFPLMMKYAQTIDRTSPGDLLWRAIRHGITAGEFSKDTPDSDLINHYSRQIENYYQAHRDALAVASQNSTAPTTQATVPVADKQADASQPGVRTITNASASAAPATPPAPAAPPAPIKQQKMSEEARRRSLAAKHFGSD